MPFLAWRVFGWQSVDITADWKLRDVAPGRAYALCNTLACMSCGLIFLDMRFDDEEMSALYADYRGDTYRMDRERFEPGYGHRNDLLLAGSNYIPRVEELLEPHLSAAPRILDWGGDTGVNTPFRARCGCHHVYDISVRPLVGGAVRVTRNDVAASTYDLVVLSHVLEHVSFPRDVIADIIPVLTRDTLLYIELPHENLMRLEISIASKSSMKRHWHEHINFFTERAIETLLDQAGLETLMCISHSIVAGGQPGHVFSLLARLKPGTHAICAR